MKTRLNSLRLAGLAALATCSLAQAQSTVTLYGNVDVYLESYRSNSKPAVTQLSSGGLASSKWGLRGSEDLGGGLKTTFKLESGLKADTGAGGSALFERGANVGLESTQWGALVLGRQNAPMNDALVWTDSDWATNFSPVTPLLLNPGSNGFASISASGVPQFGPMHLRQSNQVSYNTPAYKGFDAKVAVALGEKAALGPGVTARNAVGASLRYNQGPVLATLALHQGGQDTAAGANKQNAYNLALRYNLGAATVSADFYSNTNQLANGSEPALHGTVLGVLVPRGPWAYVAQFGRVRDNGLDYAGSAKATGTSDLINLGVHYYLSKSTMLYARATHVRDSNGGFNGQPYVAAWGISPTLSGLDANQSASTVALGLYKSF